MTVIIVSYLLILGLFGEQVFEVVKLAL